MYKTPILVNADDVAHNTDEFDFDQAGPGLFDEILDDRSMEALLESITQTDLLGKQRLTIRTPVS